MGVMSILVMISNFESNKETKTIIQQELEGNQTRSKSGLRVLARDVVRIRGATGEENPPIILLIPRKVLNAANLRKGDEVRIYTDGIRIYLEKLEEPEI